MDAAHQEEGQRCASRTRRPRNWRYRGRLDPVGNERVRVSDQPRDDLNDWEDQVDNNC